MLLFSCSRRWCISRAPMLLQKFSSPWTAVKNFACNKSRIGRAGGSWLGEMPAAALSKLCCHRIIGRPYAANPARPNGAHPTTSDPQRSAPALVVATLHACSPYGSPHPEEGKESALFALGLLALAHHPLCQGRIAVEAAEEATQCAFRATRRLPLEVFLRDELAKGHTLGELTVELVQDLHLGGAEGLPRLPVDRAAVGVGPRRIYPPLAGIEGPLPKAGVQVTLG